MNPAECSEQHSSSGFCPPSLPSAGETWSLAFFWTLLILEKVALMMNPEHGFLGHTVTSLALTGYVTLDEPLGPFGSQFLTVDHADAETPSGMEVFVSRLSGFPAHKGRV